MDTVAAIRLSDPIRCCGLLGGDKLGAQPKTVVTDAPWIGLTYQIIGLAMALHNELGPGHRESVYHNGMVIKLQSAGRSFESEPYVPVTLADGTVVKGQCPDLIVEGLVVVELKAHVYTMSLDEQAQVIGYFAALPESPVALYLNFGRSRLEIHRLFPPTTVQAYRREKWGNG
jgi:GxxExxY protein